MRIFFLLGFLFVTGCGFEARPILDEERYEFAEDNSSSRESDSAPDDSAAPNPSEDEPNIPPSPVMNPLPPAPFNPPPNNGERPDSNPMAPNSEYLKPGVTPTGSRNYRPIINPFWDQFNDAEVSAASKVKCTDPKEDIRDATLVLVNFARAKGFDCSTLEMNGQTHPPVQWNESLFKAAETHVQDLMQNGRFSHTGSDGSSASLRARRAGWTGGMIGENLAGNDLTIGFALEGLLDSKGHCRIIMDETIRTHRVAADCGENDQNSVYRVWLFIFGTQSLN